MDHLLPVVNDPEFSHGLIPIKTKALILCMQFAQKILKKVYSVQDRKVPGGCDLLIFENHLDNKAATWHIILKAETAGGPESYDEILQKLEGSVRDATVHSAGWTYLIAAKGATCMAWRYRSDVSKVQPMQVLDGSVNIDTLSVRGDTTRPLSKEYAISNPVDQREIVTLLDYIRDNPNPGPTSAPK
ncbi:hypothetical protein H0H92_009266 [Tricholoma furcatifolium]|nr:hypothetical protein H0H92_009266 [Tricholoma furcatifolium]